MAERVLILSGHYPVSHWQAHTNHKIAADSLGFDYVHAAHATAATDPYMHKLNWFQEYLGSYEYVFWIDDDSFFLDFQKEDAKSLMEAPIGFFLKSRIELKGVPMPPINSAFLGLRSSPRAFELLEQAREMTDAQVQALWGDADGHRYGGDQDRLWVALKRLHLLQTGEIELVDSSALNGRHQDLFPGDGLRQDVKILHLTGRTNKKWKKLRDVRALLNSGPGLVPKDVLEDYPAIARGQHRLIASRLADHPWLHPLARLIPRKLLISLGGK